VYNKLVYYTIYQIVKKIPKGKVAAYGMIAKQVGVDPRVVGWALHANRDRGNPCHRVVDRNGRLAKGYAFGGPEEQKRKLKAERVRFKRGKVDLKNHPIAKFLK
jgi:methylated-DNA-protein-cysteine methyltransferase-like protein